MEIINKGPDILSRSVGSNSLQPCDPRAHQVPLSMGFSRQENGVGCHFPLQGPWQITDIQYMLTVIMINYYY